MVAKSQTATDKLRPRDKVIIEMAASGANMPAIAQAIGITPQSVSERLNRPEIAKAIDTRIKSKCNYRRLSLERKHEILADIAETEDSKAVKPRDRIAAIHTDNLMSQVYAPGGAGADQITQFNNILIQIGVLPSGSQVPRISGPVGKDMITEGEIIEPE